MAWRFRKSKKIAPGVRLNATKNGLGVTIGGKAGRVSVSPKGRVTVGASVPGTGISYSKQIASGKKKNGVSPKKQNGKMERVVCESCNASSFSQDGEYLVCDYCGARYTRENVGDTSTCDDAPMVQNKWYQRTGWIIFFLVIFPPIGIAMTWLTKNSWSKSSKIIATVLSALFLLYAVGCSSPATSASSSSASSSQVEKVDVFQQYTNDFNRVNPDYQITGLTEGTRSYERKAVIESCGIEVLMKEGSSGFNGVAQITFQRHEDGMEPLYDCFRIAAKMMIPSLSDADIDGICAEMADTKSYKKELNGAEIHCSHYYKTESMYQGTGLVLINLK